MSDRGLVDLAQQIADILERLGVRYAIGGSLASSTHGEPRASRDVDLVAELGQEHVAGLLAACRPEFFVDEDMARDAVRQRASFNLIHLASALKVDIFVARDRPLAQEELRRRARKRLTDDGKGVYVVSAEDIVLQKLEWYRRTNETSDRQWRDVLGVLKVQAGRIDRDYLCSWATSIGVLDLLERAFRDSGL